MTKSEVCSNCGSTQWEDVDSEIRCAYCGVPKSQRKQQFVNDDEISKYRFDYLKENNRTVLIILGFMMSLLIFSSCSMFLISDSSSESTQHSTSPLEKLELKVETLSVVGKTGEEATQEIKKVDKDAKIKYVKKSMLGSLFEDKPTSDLSLKVSEMQVNYSKDDHEVTLTLE